MGASRSTDTRPRDVAISRLALPFLDLLGTGAQEAGQAICRRIWSTGEVRRGNRRAQPKECLRGVNDVTHGQHSVVVDIAGVGAVGSATQKQERKKLNRIGDISRSVAIAIAAKELRPEGAKVCDAKKVIGSHRIEDLQTGASQLRRRHLWRVKDVVFGHADDGVTCR